MKKTVEKNIVKYHYLAGRFVNGYEFLRGFVLVFYSTIFVVILHGSPPMKNHKNGEKEIAQGMPIFLACLFLYDSGCRSPPGSDLNFYSVFQFRLEVYICIARILINIILI